METRSFVAFDFDSLLMQLFLALDDQPEYSPRGMKVKELFAPRLELVDPRCRILGNETREANYGFAVGEFLWYWRGANDLETMQYYNKRMKAFSDDGKTLNSAYGERIKNHNYWDFVDTDSYGNSQWLNCIKELARDNDSRRAVLFIDNPSDHVKAIGVGSKDVPCTLALQFLLRDGELHLHVTMRSNDSVWGLTYDLFSFTLLQECMMLELRKKGITCELGVYVHTAGSMHVYERHYPLMFDFAKEMMRSDSPVTAAPMEPIDSLESLDALLIDEELLRLGKIAAIDETKYNGACKWMVGHLNAHRKKRDAEGVKNV